MASVMFGLILHFQYAYGWSPMKAGLANLPMIATMLLATPLSEALITRFGHRMTCFIGAMALAGSLVGMAWGVEHGYLAIAISMVVMTIGLRTVMTVCAVALIGGGGGLLGGKGGARSGRGRRVGPDRPRRRLCGGRKGRRGLRARPLRPLQ